MRRLLARKWAWAGSSTDGERGDRNAHACADRGRARSAQGNRAAGGRRYDEERAGSIIGATPESALRRFLTGIPNRLELSEADPQLRGAVIDVDEATGQARSIRRVKVTGIEGKDTLAE